MKSNTKTRPNCFHFNGRYSLFCFFKLQSKQTPFSIPSRLLDLASKKYEKKNIFIHGFSCPRLCNGPNFVPANFRDKTKPLCRSLIVLIFTNLKTEQKHQIQEVYCRSRWLKNIEKMDRNVCFGHFILSSKQRLSRPPL